MHWKKQITSPERRIVPVIESMKLSACFTQRLNASLLQSWIESYVYCLYAMHQQVSTESCTSNAHCSHAHWSYNARGRTSCQFGTCFQGIHLHLFVLLLVLAACCQLRWTHTWQAAIEGNKVAKLCEWEWNFCVSHVNNACSPLHQTAQLYQSLYTFLGVPDLFFLSSFFSAAQMRLG